MTIAITIGATGLAGWSRLQNNESRHLETVAKDPVVQRSTAYFREKITGIESAEHLVKDYRLLSVALGAFGLEQDVGSKAFIQKVLESDINDDESLVNRLSDKRYLRLATAFGYGGPESSRQDLGSRISEAYLQREFERRVGEADENLRLALNTRRELAQMRDRESSDRTLWFEVLGNPPLRKVFEGAFGFGSSYGKLPIDRQVIEFSKASERILGTSSFSELSSESGTDRLVKNFLARSQLTESATQNRYSTALALLSG